MSIYVDYTQLGKCQENAATGENEWTNERETAAATAAKKKKMIVPNQT